jgi:hypothetical protein
MSDKNSPHELDETAAHRMLINPFYAITIAEDLFGSHEPLVSQEDWVKANARLIDELGAEVYLHELLKVLSGDFPRQPE